MTHLPTGLSVRVTQERTQQANRAIALQRLTAKLLVVLEEQRAAALAELRGDLVKAEWGQQVRAGGRGPGGTRGGAGWGRQRGVCAALFEQGGGAFFKPNGSCVGVRPLGPSPRVSF
jgi:hypothetical protein